MFYHILGLYTKVIMLTSLISITYTDTVNELKYLFIMLDKLVPITIDIQNNRKCLIDIKKILT